MEYSDKNLTDIVKRNIAVYYEIEARDTAMRMRFNAQQRREILPWTMLGRKALQEEEFRIWVDLDNKTITDDEAIGQINNLLQQYYNSISTA